MEVFRVILFLFVSGKETVVTSTNKTQQETVRQTEELADVANTEIFSTHSTLFASSGSSQEDVNLYACDYVAQVQVSQTLYPHHEGIPQTEISFSFHRYRCRLILCFVIIPTSGTHYKKGKVVS